MGKGITYSTELNGTFSDGDYAPFWLSANKYGLSSIKNNSGYVRAGLFRNISVDSLKLWKFGYGLDVAIATNHTSDMIIQQLYGEVQYKKGTLTIGAKQMPLIFKNKELSTGDMTYSINARRFHRLALHLTTIGICLSPTVGLVSKATYPTVCLLMETGRRTPQPAQS